MPGFGPFFKKEMKKISFLCFYGELIAARKSLIVTFQIFKLSPSILIPEPASVIFRLGSWSISLDTSSEPLSNLLLRLVILGDAIYANVNGTALAIYHHVATLNWLCLVQPFL